jgi:hypothetical protein
VNANQRLPAREITLIAQRRREKGFASVGP